jgi:hypothetical protein
MAKRIKINTLIFTLVTLGYSTAALSANWLMLQGTERPDATHNFWGFVQPAYTNDRGDDLQGLIGTAAANNGKRVANNVIAPEYEDDTEFHFRRARVGARGRFTGKARNEFTAKINYFTLVELAPNLMTYDPFGDRARAVAPDHFSLTFNHIKGARVRAGLFKTPGPEETFQAIHTFSYIEFTDFVGREILERFVSGNAPCPGCTNTAVGTPTKTGYGFNAVRDWGVQVFDAFRQNDWTLSYAAMLGRGEGIHETSDTDDNRELYLYGSAEYDLPGGKGPRKHGIKLFGWQQKGKRSFSTDTTHQEFDRIRKGAGFVALGNLFGGKYRHRISAEYMLAQGMIFIAPAGNVKGGNLMYATDKENEARGYYIDYGFFLDKHWEFDIRYDRDDLLHKQAANIGALAERQITATTVGVNYHVSPRQRFTANYIMRDAKAPNAQPGGLATNVPIIVDSLGDRLALQYTWIF